MLKINLFEKRYVITLELTKHCTKGKYNEIN